MTAPTLRPYQRDAINAVLTARRAGVRRQLVCLPTGSGKTVIFSALAQLAKRPVLVLAHRSELLAQAADKLQRALGPHRPVAIEQGPQRAPAGVSAVVASIRSLRSDRLAALRERFDFGLVVYDECHHAAADDNTRVLRELGAFDPDWSGTLLGFTATTERGDGQGLDSVFEQIVYDRPLPEMVADGFLVPLRGFRVTTHADLQHLVGGTGDLGVTQLAEAVDIEDRNALVARSIQELSRDRRIIVFCVNVRHAGHLSRSLNALGVRCARVHGAMPADRRADVLADFRSGRLQAITNVAVLTEGFDDPGVSCIAMARPTRSAGLYAQCVGRGTRLAPGKTDCLVLDFVDLGDLDLVTLPSLFGMPRQLDLQGEDATEAARLIQGIAFDQPHFDMEAAGITLAEIQDRAAAFDPLTMAVDAEVRAISANAWCSLGKSGVALHIERRPGRFETWRVLRTTGRGKRWRVLIGETERARFSRLEDAVEAADFEVSRLPRGAAASAHPGAAWRQSPPPASLVEQLQGRTPTSHGEALQLLSLQRSTPSRRR